MSASYSNETASASLVSVMTLGDRLKKLRAERDWTLYAAAKASQMSQATYTKLESGLSANPGMDVLRRLSAGFGVPVDGLVAASVIPYGENHDAGRPEHTVPIPVVGVAAGGSPVESEDLREEYPLLRHLFKSGRYAIRLFGDSMWPTLWDRDLLLVEPASSVPNGKIAIVRVGGGASMVKRVHRRKKDGSWTLRSDNPTHPLVEAEADEVEVIARFLKIVEGDRQ